MPYQDIQTGQVEALLQRDNLVVIDMRDGPTQVAGTLPNAQPSTDELISTLARRRRRAPPVLVYCYHGNASRDLCSLLEQFGLPEIYNLSGGWAAWESHQATIAADDNALQPWLVARGFDPEDLNSRITNGMTPLMSAALEGELELLDTLLAAGADASLTNDDQHHALWFACVNDDPRLVRRLIDAGCDLDQFNVNGITCAIYAASAGRLDALRALAKAGADLSLRTPDGYDALDCAATLPVLRFLKPLVRFPIGAQP